jgi:hypothetical protein
VLVLDERHQVHVVLASDYEDALARIPFGVRVFKNIEQVAALDVEDASSNPMPRSFLSFAFFASSQAKYFRLQDITMCARKAHTGIGRNVPASVPKRGPTAIIRQPTPTKFSIKNGPEIVSFRPVL